MSKESLSQKIVQLEEQIAKLKVQQELEIQSTKSISDQIVKFETIEQINYETTKINEDIIKYQYIKQIATAIDVFDPVLIININNWNSGQQNKIPDKFDKKILLSLDSLQCIRHASDKIKSFSKTYPNGNLYGDKSILSSQEFIILQIILKFYSQMEEQFYNIGPLIHKYNSISEIINLHNDNPERLLLLYIQNPLEYERKFNNFQIKYTMVISIIKEKTIEYSKYPENYLESQTKLLLELQKKKFELIK